MTASLHVAICIVGFHNFDDIRECLEALAKSTHSDFEVIICENGGPAALGILTANVEPRLAAGQPITILSAPDNPGYAAGVNICIKASPRADAWWVLNPDTRPDPAALGLMVGRLQRGDCEAVGCTVHHANGVVQSRGGVWRPWLARAESVEHGASLQGGLPAAALEARVNYLSGASMLVARAFIERAGFMREDYFLYAEEVEWCVRAVQAGCRLGLAPEAQVMHQQGTTTGSVSRMSDRQKMPVYLDERNKLLLTRDRFPLRLPIAASAAFFLLFLRFARRGAWRQLQYGICGWLAGLRNERGKPRWLNA